MGPENKTGSNNITSIAIMSQSSSFLNNQITDASGDSTPMQVAHDGAINIDLQNITLQGDQKAHPCRLLTMEQSTLTSKTSPCKEIRERRLQQWTSKLEPPMTWERSVCKATKPLCLLIFEVS